MSTFTYNIANNIGIVRLNIADIDTTTTTGARSTWTMLFTDEEINVFLARASNDVNLASAYALQSIASSKALLAKMVKIGDYSEDLNGLAKSLREQAALFITTSNDTPAFAVAQQSVTDFAAAQIVLNHYMES